MDTKITAAIVDDEQGNRENLLRMIGNYCPQIRISAICSSVIEARTVLPEAKPDILFLDIRLGDDTGFSLLGSLPEIPFEVIFVTAYDSYAIQAIRFSALDYLLKPIDPEELTHAVDKESNYTTFYLKSGEKLIVSKTLKEFDELLAPYHFLRVHQSHLINLDEIKSFIKSDGGYIRMKDGASVSISRQRRNNVMEVLKQL